jgi:glycoside/pentoside/hexuronide:cation symporter, GPH family
MSEFKSPSSPLPSGAPPTSLSGPQPPTPSASSPAPLPVMKPKAYSAGEWPIHAWGIGAIASYFMYEQFYLINNIHTTVFKVDPLWVGVILAAPRLVDGVLDPILGHWSDNMRSRWGRRRPFLLFSAILGAVLASVLFWMNPDWSQLAKCLFLAFCAITLFTATGTYDMSYTALGYELSEDYADRSRIQAIRSVYAGIMGIVGGYVIWLAKNFHTSGDFLFGKPPHNWWSTWASWRGTFVTQVVDKAGNITEVANRVLGYRVISAVVSLLILGSVIFPLLYSKERYTSIVSKAHVSLWKALKATLKCRPFVVILVINIARGAGTLPRNLFFFIGTFSVCYGDEGRYTSIMAGLYALVAYPITVAMWPLANPLTRWIGKRPAFIWGAAVALLQAIGTPFVATPGNVWGWFAFNLVFFVISAVLGAPAAGIMPDICDIDELAYGERREGLFTAVISFVNKMEISVMTLLTGVFIKWTGYDANLETYQPQTVLDRMRWMGFTPLIAISAIAFIVSCFMPITAKMMEKVRAELDARHAAEGLAVSPAEGAKA